MLYVSDEKREEFWDYLTSESIDRPRGVTPKRLEKIKVEVLADNFLWNDVIGRFGASKKSAKEFYAPKDSFNPRDNFNASSSRWNFWAMVREKISLLQKHQI